MKTVTVLMEQEKVEALGYYLEKEGKAVQTELEKNLKELYEKTVPEEAREYIEFQAKQRMEAKASKAQKEQKTQKQTAKVSAADKETANTAGVKEHKDVTQV